MHLARTPRQRQPRAEPRSYVCDPPPHGAAEGEGCRVIDGRGTFTGDAQRADVNAGWGLIADRLDHERVAPAAEPLGAGSWSG